MATVTRVLIFLVRTLKGFRTSRFAARQSRLRFAIMAVLLLLCATAHAAVPHLRVIVPRAAVRTGPGFTFRELYRAQSGEVMEVVDRNGAYWFRVIIPDGRYGWIYGEQVVPFEVDPAVRDKRILGAWIALVDPTKE